MINSPTKISARVTVNPDGGGFMNSVFGELDTTFPPTPRLVDEKLAMLKMCTKGQRVEGVGKRQSSNIFYLWFTPEEVKELLKEKTRG